MIFVTLLRRGLVQAGVDLYKVQRLLGHKSPTMTQRYAHHYPESLRDGVEVLDRKGGISTNLAQRGEAATSVLQLVENWCPRSELNRRPSV